MNRLTLLHVIDNTKNVSLQDLLWRPLATGREAYQWALVLPLMQTFRHCCRCMIVQFQFFFFQRIRDAPNMPFIMFGRSRLFRRTGRMSTVPKFGRTSAKYFFSTTNDDHLQIYLNEMMQLYM